VAPDPATALDWAMRLRALDTVRGVTTVGSLVPAEQDEKLLVLDDIALLMGHDFAALDRAAPDAERLERSLGDLRRELQNAPSPDTARGRLEDATAALLDRLNQAADARKTDILDALDEDIAGNLPIELERLALALD